MRKELVLNDQLVSYLYFPGAPEKPALIFLHGWRSQGAVWENTVQNLKNNIEIGDIFCIDLPGFGLSAKLKADYDLNDYCRTIMAFKEKIHLKDIIIIGHSFGGRIIIKLLGEEPDFALRAVLVDSAGLINNRLRKKIITFFAKIARPIFWPKFMKTARKQIYRAFGAEDYLSTPELRGTFVKVIGEDLSHYLDQITCPIKIIWGSLDIETPVSDAKFMHERIVDSELAVFEGAGHFSFLERPEEFNKELINFIEKNV